MAFTNGENGLSAADIAAVTGNQNGFGGFGGDGAWLILILLLFAAFNGNGWSGNGGGGYVPMQADLQRGFDQTAVMNGIGAVQGGLADAAISNCNQFTTLLGTLANNKFDTISTLNNGHNAILQQMGNFEMARQQCCCNTNSLIGDLKYTVATENCEDRRAISDGVRDIITNQNANTQAILDKMCQQEIDALKTQNANLQTQINLANLAASQNGQTAQILADNANQTAVLRQALNPTPVPAYVVQNPNGGGCGCGTYNGCGCM